MTGAGPSRPDRSGTDLSDLGDLVSRYAAGVDDRDVDAVAALFTEDGVLAAAAPPQHLAPVTEHVGHDGVRRAMEGVLALRGSFHALAGEVFTPGDSPHEATGRVACEAHHFLDTDDGPVDLVWTVTYRDDYRIVNGGWRFARREVHVGSVATRPLKVVS